MPLSFYSQTMASSVYPQSQDILHSSAKVPNAGKDEYRLANIKESLFLLSMIIILWLCKETPSL